MIKKWKGLILIMAVFVAMGVCNNAQAETGANGQVSTIVVQPNDNKILVGGEFKAYDGVARNGIARLNYNGKLDESFNPVMPRSTYGVRAIAVQPNDGKIIVGGLFYNDGGSFFGIIRLNSNGTIDTTFNSGIGADGHVTSIVIQPSDKKIIIGGFFKNYNGIARGEIARLNTDGTLDMTFDPGIGVNGGVGSIAIQPDDNKIIIGGEFTSYNGMTAKKIARINVDGTLDSSFNSGNSGCLGLSIKDIAIQSQDNKIIIVGDFVSYNGIARKNIARLNATGTLDTIFNPGSGPDREVLAVDFQTIGTEKKILIGGGFIYYNGITRRRIARVNDNGTLDTSFNPGSGVNNNYTSVLAVTTQFTDKILFGGNFTSYNGSPLNRFGRLNSNGMIDQSFGKIDIITGGFIETQPIKIRYNAGEMLDLSGMVVALRKSDGNTEYVSADNFSQNNITTYKNQGDILNVDDNKIIIRYEGGVSAMSFELEQLISVEYVIWSSDEFTYGDSNRDSRENLVVITHGLNGSATNDWLFAMRNHILENSDNTTVKLYDWTLGAHSSNGGFIQVDNIEVFQPIYKHASEQGPHLAKHITDYKTPPKNIHLIAHSVGSNLIQETIKELDEAYKSSPWKEYYQNHPDVSKPFIHLTFLDAFAPWDSDKAERYGNLYDFDGYAEQYVDNVANLFDDFAYTNMHLHGAVNFDVTYLTGADNRTHNWPINFYNESFKSLYKAPGNNSLEGDYLKLGFRFARESKSYMQPEKRRDQWCIITNVSEPYRRCFGEKKIEDRDVILTDPNQPAPTIVGSKLVDVSQFIGFINDEDEDENDNQIATGRLPEINMSSKIALPGTIGFSTDVTVNIPNNTIVTSSIPGWNGIFSTPTVSELNEFDDGWKSGYTSFEIGIRGGTLQFDNAVKITLIGKAGPNIRVGYSMGEYNFEDIQQCDSSQVLGSYIPEGGSCWVNEGDNLVIWTKHFTTFAVYELNDIIPPFTTISTSGEQGDNSWFKSDVQITLLANDEDGGSGVERTEYSINGGEWAGYTGSFPISEDGIHNIKYRSIDKAGNVEEIRTAEIKIDKTPPTININTPKEGEKYILDSVLTADWSATDDGSGIENSSGTLESGSLIDTSSVGEKEFEVTATDKAGNSDTKTVKYNIVYDFSGFQGPVAEAGKTFNGNSTIPIAFQLTDANGNYISDVSATIKVDNKDAVASGKSNEGNLFRYNSLTNQYIFNLSLKDTLFGAGEHTLNIDLGDGVIRSQSIVIE